MLTRVNLLNENVMLPKLLIFQSLPLSDFLSIGTYAPEFVLNEEYTCWGLGVLKNGAF